MIKKKYKTTENLSETDKEELEGIYKQNISALQENINDLLSTIDEPLGDMFPDIIDNVTKVGNIEAYDYDREIEILKIEAKETLECLANLYLDKKTMRKKNISSLIKSDTKYLSTLNWQIESTRRSIIQAMQQLDLGIADPEMYKALAPLQKELRDSVKSAQELQRKMKDFYKEVRDEMTKEAINTESEKTLEESVNPVIDSDLYIVSQSDLDKIYDNMKNDPNFMKDVNR
jgi:hypothetical protein